MGGNEPEGNGWASGLFLLVFGILSLVNAVTRAATNSPGFTIALVILGILLCSVAILLLYGTALRIMRALAERGKHQAPKRDTKSNIAA
jgi:uncharacterized membrane protein YidH (DUF202 family)